MGAPEPGFLLGEEPRCHGLAMGVEVLTRLGGEGCLGLVPQRFPDPAFLSGGDLIPHPLHHTRANLASLLVDMLERGRGPTPELENSPLGTPEDDLSRLVGHIGLALQLDHFGVLEDVRARLRQRHRDAPEPPRGVCPLCRLPRVFFPRLPGPGLLQMLPACLGVLAAPEMDPLSNKLPIPFVGHRTLPTHDVFFVRI